MIVKGELQGIEDIKEEFGQMISRDKTTLAGEFIRILLNDMNGTKSSFNQHLKLSTREKALYLFLSDLETNSSIIQDLLRNLDNEQNPLLSNLSTLTSGDKLPFIAAEIPRYFQLRL